jgi:ribosomal protein L32
MAVPKKKTSYSKSRSRRMMNMKLKPVNFYLDDNGEACLSHRINSNGFYKGRKIFSDSQEKKIDNNQYDNNEQSALTGLNLNN